MAINKNHLFEDLNGIKCAIVESNISASRADFLQSLLEFNRYTVVRITAPPPPPAKTAAPVAAPPAEGEQPQEAPPPPPEEKFTLGVTDMTFNPTNAIYGRLLKTREGRIVTMAYWLQKETFSHDEIPYYDRKVS